jgi:hypothetical protein
LLFADASGAAGALRIDGDRRARVDVPVAPLAPAAGPVARIEVAARAIELAGGGLESARVALDSPL